MNTTNPDCRGIAETADTWQAASRLVDFHGSEAATFAARKALSMAATGDSDGYLLWLRILKAVDCLLENTKATDPATLVA